MKCLNLVPNLSVTEMDRSIAFYRDVLGFAVERTVPDGPPFVFAWMKREAVDVFLNDAAVMGAELARLQRAPAPTSGGIALYLIIEGLDAFYASLQGRVAIGIPLERKFYGMAEFTIQDPDGYVLTFAERRE